MCRSTSYARVTRPLCWAAFIRRSLVTLFIHLDILIRLETLRKVENLIFSCAICQIGLESELPRIRVDSFVLLISFVTRKLASVDQSVYFAYHSSFLLHWFAHRSNIIWGRVCKSKNVWAIGTIKTLIQFGIDAETVRDTFSEQHKREHAYAIRTKRKRFWNRKWQDFSP